MADSSKRTQAAVRYVVKHFQLTGHSFVYLVESQDSFYKIGYSTDVNKRMRQLETGSSDPVRLIAVAPGGRPLEQKLHHRFRNLRTHLEWFKDPTQRILQRFVELPGSMVFLPGYVTMDAPVLPPSVTINS